ncbi:MAG TPA: hypothetical protein VEZ40_20595 [Pyrinomonadaceae bacterium]|nr:hypothetical protein [Pyrinomonadaceae bacterium]
MGTHNDQQVGKAQREYIEGIFTVYQNQADFLKHVKQNVVENPTNFKGRVVSLETSANPSLAFGNVNGGDLATPSAETLENITVTYQWMNSGLEHQYGAILNANAETVADPLKRSVKSAGKQFAAWLNFYLSAGDGTTRLATASTAYNAGAPTVFIANGATDSLGATMVLKDQYVKVYDPTGTTQRMGTVGSGSIKVASVTKTQITGATNFPSDFIVGDIIVPEGSNTIGIKGVPYLVKDTGAYFNGSRTTTPQLQSTYIAVGGALTALQMLNCWELASDRAGRDEDEETQWLTIACGMTQHAAYYNLTQVSPSQQYFAHTGTDRPGVDVGGRSMKFTWFGAPIKKFSKFPGNKMYFLDMSAFNMAVLKKVGALLDMPAGEWLQAINGATNTYKASRVKWMDFAGDMYSPTPQVHGCLDTLSVSGLPQQKGG